MVLAEWGASIYRAIQQMSDAAVIDEKVDKCLDKIIGALVQSDFDVKLVRDMELNMKKFAVGHHKCRAIRQAIFDKLCEMLDRGPPGHTPERGNRSVVMFVGLEGSGKTTTCTKYACYHKRDGWNPALVCASTLRAGFDQLKEDVDKAVIKMAMTEIPIYGSYTESDPVKIAVEGVDRFTQKNFDLIIVDTNGCHKQGASEFEEMHQIYKATKPDLVIFVMDISIGQAAIDQAQAFKQCVAVGAVILTKMDGPAKGGGALSAVAATKSPVIFLGTGPHMHQFRVFDVKTFLKRLLGKGDWSVFMDEMHEVVPMDQQPEVLQKLSEGTFILRTLYDEVQDILQTTGQKDQVFVAELMPRGREKENQTKLECYKTMMDSMTNEELDSTNAEIMDESRILRIAAGSGSQVRDVEEMLKECKHLAEILTKARQ